MKGWSPPRTSPQKPQAPDCLGFFIYKKRGASAPLTLCHVILPPSYKSPFCPRNLRGGFGLPVILEGSIFPFVFIPPVSRVGGVSKAYFQTRCMCPISIIGHFLQLFSCGHVILFFFHLCFLSALVTSGAGCLIVGSAPLPDGRGGVVLICQDSSGDLVGLFDVPYPVFGLGDLDLIACLLGFLQSLGPEVQSSRLLVAHLLLDFFLCHL